MKSRLLIYTDKIKRSNTIKKLILMCIRTTRHLTSYHIPTTYFQPDSVKQSVFLKSAIGTVPFNKVEAGEERGKADVRLKTNR